MLKIVTIPNPVLTDGTKKVERFDEKLVELVKNMDQTLRAQVNPQGVGLAAPQIDKNMAIFIIKPTPEAKTEIFINPKIIKVEAGNPQGSEIKKKKKHRLEGCLSIPKIWGNVDRAHKVYLEFQDQTGKRHKKWFSGFKALIIQHEADHLRGVLFTQRALEQNQQLFEEKDGDLIPLRFQKEGVNT
ncbi:peptide deformylase [Candidatus Roizmanbacteria bacterium RIFCSPHIGHO2_01_FULL_35_10]|uniref:Peptide deformylase n=1 Tax=Candidatus Roizmanbacteria bacterium RIFCSPLOWO2_01_FULL_35_13 TaxID=1802055 RepID=A0A1F7IDF4_9BACT|nr:MAG: peptide deformylase [Candidatus Roizmanbacteria bacterium RIFCSPHIGHO2_01_FULL_35_10]OGK41371.1 MAG: peptide deformylase [Candidatus Roizmanbacteria bacterium RIFCSPLOWO2_01_FULL_35_13]